MKKYDVIIIGGSYAGLSAGMALGRSLRHVLIIDDGKPCNSQTPHSHNFITHDGDPPGDILAAARAEVEKYETVKFYKGRAVSGSKIENGFGISTEAGDRFGAKKLIFASGVKDLMPAIEGFSACWGISVIHCPYCHGYEVRHKRTGVLGNGEIGFDYVKMISNWTSDLALYTNGRSTLTTEQTKKLAQHKIRVIEKEISSFKQDKGQIRHVIFSDGSSESLDAFYARPAFEQQSGIPLQLGCEFNEAGYIQTDPFQKTSVHGVYACGDATTAGRAVSVSVAMGTLAGIFVNKEITAEEF